MSCKECVFYSLKKITKEHSWNEKEGICTRFPQHINVQERHFCGEMILKLNTCWNLKSEAKVPCTVSQAVAHSVRSKEIQKERRTEIELKKEIKELRKLYKENTGKKAIIRKKKE